MTRDVSVFVKCDTIFFILPHSRTFKFYKVVQQHTEGMVGIVFFWKFTSLSSSERIVKIR